VRKTKPPTVPPAPPLAKGIAARLPAAQQELAPPPKADALNTLGGELRPGAHAPSAPLGDAYLTANGSGWLVALDRSTALTFTPTGGVTARCVTIRLPAPK
jgi:hypothetical protein